MKNKEKPKYNLWQNVCFMVKTAWQSNKWVLVYCLAVALGRIGLNLTQLYVSPSILAKVEQGSSVGALLGTIGGFVALLWVFSGLVKYLETIRMSEEIGIRCELINRVNEKACTTSYPNAKDPAMLKLQSKVDDVTSDNSEAAEHIWRTMSDVLTSVGGFAIYLGLLTNLNPILVVVVIVTAVLSFAASRRASGWYYAHREEDKQTQMESNYFIHRSRALAFAKEVRIFGLRDWMDELRDKAMRARASYFGRTQKAYFWVDVVDLVLAFLRNGIAYAYLLRQTLMQNLSASEFLLYFSAISGFAALVNGVLSGFSKLHEEGMGISHIQEYLNWPEMFQFENGTQPPKAEGYELRLEDVTFRYPGSEKAILEHLNLTVHAGEKLAVVGLNGAGKTTLVKLLCGFYDPTEGRVLLNGQDIRKFDRRAYYRLFSAVFQEFSIFDTTVAETVAQTVKNIDYDRVKTCIEQAGLTEAIAKFPKGLETHIGREVYLDGIQLSGGQTQRLMLARALYKDGPILVLDEPTAALDPLAENDIYMKYNEMTAKKTSIFISHRLASTRFCDRIIFVAEGKIQEEGTHESLLARNGAYAELFHIQSRYYQEGVNWDEEI